MDHIGLLTVITLVLAAYRITRLVVADQFPFEPVRLWAHGRPFWGDLLVCPFCVSVWVGGFLAAGQALVGDGVGWHIFIGAMALSAVVSLLASLAPHSFD
jgi:hypothetical protein